MKVREDKDRARGDKVVRALLIGVVCVGFAAVMSILLAGGHWVNRQDKVTSEESAERLLSRLDVGLSVDRYVDLLGRKADISRPAGVFQELLWIDPLYAVQVVVGPAQEVVAYSITTRSDKVHPKIGPLGDFPLGTGTIAQAMPETGTSVLVSSVGPTARGVWWYSEAIPASGATHDRAVVVTASDAGLGKPGEPDITELGVPPSSGPTVGPFETYAASDPRVRLMRNRLAPSTYSILGPRLALEQLPADFRFGPSTEDE